MTFSSPVPKRTGEGDHDVVEGALRRCDARLLNGALRPFRRAARGASIHLPRGRARDGGGADFNTP